MEMIVPPPSQTPAVSRKGRMRWWKRSVLLICGLILVLAVWYISLQGSRVSGVVYDGSGEAISSAQLRGRTYDVVFVNPKSMGVLYGLAYGGVAKVRSGLPTHMRRFVLLHEIYHLQDWAGGGPIMREVRANAAGLAQEPLGFLQTAWMTLSDGERMKFYWKTYINN